MLRNKLVLAKTHDYAAAKEPKLAVVMIHGIASDSATYHEALEYLENNRSLNEIRFITFDLLGSGKSLKSDELNYDYHDQVTALHNSIRALKLGKTPLVLIGHSLGTFIVTKYAATHEKTVQSLILVSPPIYTPEDLDNPAFAAGMKMFRDAVGLKNHKILEDKAFNNSMDRIVLNRNNYQTLSEIKVPTVLIYGVADQLIASYNVPKVLKDNSKYVKAIKTNGRHGITEDKYRKIGKILEEALNAQDI